MSKLDETFDDTIGLTRQVARLGTEIKAQAFAIRDVDENAKDRMAQLQSRISRLESTMADMAATIARETERNELLAVACQALVGAGEAAERRLSNQEIALTSLEVLIQQQNAQAAAAAPVPYGNDGTLYRCQLTPGCMGLYGHREPCNG